MLWINERQRGRRNINDDQRTALASDAQEIRARISRVERASVAGKTVGVGRPKNSSADDSAAKLKPKERRRDKETRAAVAKEYKTTEKKLRHVAKLKKSDKEVGTDLLGMVRAWPCYARRMKLNLTAADFSRITIEFQRHAPILLWRIAPRRPTHAARMLTLRRAQCLAGLARALDADPNLRERRRA
jgi:hypothetical protein